MKKILIFLILLIPIKVLALGDNAASNILIEASTGTIISEKNSDIELPMASMTKMMTLLIVMEKLDVGKITLIDSVPISEKAASMGGSQVYLSANTNMPLETLLKSVCIASANDSAVALAEYISGSTDEFVKLMNKRASELGLKHTNFMNVHGLDEDNHYSSAHDMAFIARELLKHESILKYTSIYEDYVKHPDGTSTWIVNTNKLINYYEGLDGLKTGYTVNSGYCITATAKRNNMRLISVVMNEPDNKTRNQDTIELLNYGFANYKIETIVPKTQDLGTIDIKFGTPSKTKLILKNDATDLSSNIEENNYSYEIVKDKVEAPLAKGDIVGHIKIYSNDTVINTYDLTINENIRKSNFFEFYLKNIKNYLKGYY